MLCTDMLLNLMVTVNMVSMKVILMMYELSKDSDSDKRFMDVFVLCLYNIF